MRVDDDRAAAVHDRELPRQDELLVGRVAHDFEDDEDDLLLWVDLADQSTE